VQAIGGAVADAVDRRRFLDRQGGLELSRIARLARKPAADACRCRAGSCAALRAFLRIIRGPRRPFWQVLHDDRVPLPSGVTGRRQRSRVGGARRSAVLLGARRCAFTRRQSKTTAGVRMKTSENRARTHDENENLFLGDAVSGTRLPMGGVIRALLCVTL